MKISKTTSAIINVIDLILKMRDSGLQGVRANAYQLQLVSPVYDFLQNLKYFTAGNIHKHLSQWKFLTSGPLNCLKLRFAEELAQNAIIPQ